MEQEIAFSAKGHLFVTDLDGTLLGPDSRVSASSAAMITDLSGRGAMITVATARTPATVDRLLADTHISLPAIVMTGAALWDMESRRYIDAQFIPVDIAGAILDECRSMDVMPFIYVLDGEDILNVYHNGRMSANECKFVEERKGLPLKRFHLDEAAGFALDLSCTVLFLAFGPLAEIYTVARRLTNTLPCNVSAYPDIFSPGTAIMEVFADGVSKAAAVERLADMVDAKRITVFGDNLNDIPMMEVADVAVAVDNAMPEVKRMADMIIGPNTSDSVARYIASRCL